MKLLGAAMGLLATEMVLATDHLPFTDAFIPYDCYTESP